MNDWNKVSQEAHQLRQQNQEYYDTHNVEPTEVNGIVVRSRLEALWIEQISPCKHFVCIECFKVPVWIDGPYGRFLSSYKPDLVVLNEDGKILVELKPTKELALSDDRQARAMELNPSYKFLVIGGYPYESRGVTVRLLTRGKERTFHQVSVCDVLKFLGCDCDTL